MCVNSIQITFIIGFRLTIRNVNKKDTTELTKVLTGFRLTIRNVNPTASNFPPKFSKVLD